jgi:soluble lytic murein transglycosylase
LSSTPSRLGRSLWLLLAVTCAGHEPLSTPTQSAASFSGAERVARDLDASAAEFSPAESAPLTLDTFAPLTSLSKFESVRSALDRNDAAVAAKEARALVPEDAPPELRARYLYLAARLSEQAGALEPALDAYASASELSSPLAPYANYGAARLLSKLGKASEAEARLTRSEPPAALLAATSLLAAELARGRGDSARAIAERQRYLSQSLTLEELALGRVELAELLLGRPGAGPTSAGAPPPELAERLEALRLARLSEAATTDAKLVERAKRTQRDALASLDPTERKLHERPEPSVVLEQVRRLLDDRKFEAAEKLAVELSARQPATDPEPERCLASLFRAKALAGQRAWGKAADALTKPLAFCDEDPDQAAELLFVAAKYSAADSRYVVAAELYERLEAKFPKHRLADDSRLGAALAHLKLGNEARFTELLSDMLEVYPAGDVSLDGVFELAVRRMERRDWSGALSLLERVMKTYQDDAARGTEVSGRERYFYARSLLELGQKERGLAELEALVKEVPLSYYMLHAYSRLRALEPSRAATALEASRVGAMAQEFRFQARPEFEEPPFKRALELLSVGEVESARRELELSGLSSGSAAPPVLWGIGLLYAKAGLDREAHTVVRGLLSDWLHRWPAGDWVKAWELAFPRPYEKFVQKEALRSQIGEALIYAVMREESAFDPAAESPASAYGLMQLIEPTARSMAKPLGLPSTPHALKQPSINIALGARTLSKLGAGFEKNPVLAIPGYNAGPGRPRRWLKERPATDFDVWVELIPIRETRRYTKRVLAARAAYAAVYYPDQLDAALVMPERLTL